MSTFILKKIFSIIAGTNAKWKVKIKFANNSEYKNFIGEEKPDLGIIFHTVGAQWWTILFLPIGFFEGYVDGKIDLEGENPIHKLAHLGHTAGIENKNRSRFLSQSPLTWLRHKWCEWTQDNIKRERAIKNAEFHYSLPVELFKYKLGETIGYSEGYWVEGTENINQAKHNLYEYICQKLQFDVDPIN